MSVNENQLGQPIGETLASWRSVPTPSRTVMEGRFCLVEPIDIDRHASGLFRSFKSDKENRIWTYLPYGPFDTEADLRAWMQRDCLANDPLFHAIVDKKSDCAVGVASYLRIDESIGVIEVGHINYSPVLQRTCAATEAMFLMMRRVFAELGNRRYEWKCDALNVPSRKAAERLGFRFEGIFRQATIYKNRNRDTAWYSMLDKEWPDLEAAYFKWLSDDNFDDRGQQRASLSAMINEARETKMR